MKVATISDLHLDGLARREKTDVDDIRQQFARALNDEDFEVLVIGGDLSNDAKVSTKIAHDLEQDLARPVFYVPGNHDLYNIHNKMTTADIVQFLKDDPRCLFGRTVDFGDGSSVMGHIGWYDYSYAPQDEFTFEQFESKSHVGRKWRDVDFIDWGISDIELTKQFHKEIEEMYQTVDPDRTMLVTHMINHPNYSVSTPAGSTWPFFNAFLGSRDLFEFLAKNPVRTAVCGHVHYRFSFVFWKMEYVCACLSNKNEWNRVSIGIPLTLEAQVKDSLYIVDL